MTPGPSLPAGKPQVRFEEGVCLCVCGVVGECGREGFALLHPAAEKSFGLEIQVGKLMVSFETKHNKLLIPFPFTSSFLKAENKRPRLSCGLPDCPRLNQNLKLLPFTCALCCKQVTMIRVGVEDSVMYAGLAMKELLTDSASRHHGNSLGYEVIRSNAQALLFSLP